MNDLSVATGISIFVGLFVLGLINVVLEKRLKPKIFGLTIGLSVFVYTAVIIQTTGSRAGWVLGVFPGLLLGWGAQMQAARAYRGWRDETAPQDDFPPDPDQLNLFR